MFPHSLGRERWESQSTLDAIRTIMSDEKLWGINLSNLPGFLESVSAYVESIEKAGAKNTLRNNLTDPPTGSPSLLEAEASK